ncbi:S8 family peptidase [Piscinibacter sakaiensis]|uniref:Serine protease n=1 Tax=Piscinibacter sakaiensis TaxID=1547922 RepID=A0A0K8NVR6_PISS1|nr:S8 family peptidase [Piscinibacter sakaiensis]GAP34473.1 serine protease [Piscinibacter sakaiensis]
MPHPTFPRRPTGAAAFGALICGAAAAVALLVGAPARAADGTPARVIVAFKPGSALSRIEAEATLADPAPQRTRALAQRLGLALRSGASVGPRSQVVMADGLAAQALAQRLAADPEVASVSIDRRRRLAAAPNDPLYAVGGATGPVAGQWYLRPPNTTTPAAIDAESAWDTRTGSSSVVVAVLDTGIRFDHADLLPVAQGGPVLPGYDFVSDAPTGNDGDGRDADPSDPGDWITAAENSQAGGAFRDCGVSASSWHGTSVAGLVGAATNNGFGMAGVGRGIRVLPVRVLGKCGGFDSDIIAGMRWAAGLSVPGVPANPTPAKVINMSLGGTGTCSAAYAQAMTEIAAVGAVVVASAGNSAGHAVSEPANCAGVIAVAGLRHVGTKVGFSDLGPQIALAAPGGNCVDVTAGAACQYPILTARNAGTQVPIANSSVFSDAFNYTVGTSFAAPLVAGTAALMASVKPEITPTELRSLLLSSTRAFPTTGGDNGDGTTVPQCQAPIIDAAGKPVDQLQCYCTTSTCGAGMLDAGAAVRATAASVVVTPPPTTTPTPTTPTPVADSGGGGGGATSGAWLLGLLAATLALRRANRRRG